MHIDVCFFLNDPKRDAHDKCVCTYMYMDMYMCTCTHMCMHIDICIFLSDRKCNAHSLIFDLHKYTGWQRKTPSRLSAAGECYIFMCTNCTDTYTYPYKHKTLCQGFPGRLAAAGERYTFIFTDISTCHHNLCIYIYVYVCIYTYT